MIKYPNGGAFNKEIKASKQNKKDNSDISLSAANRGMDLENEINLSLEYYRNEDIAVFYKRPTPINIVKVDYSKGARIIDAYFEKQSTTDYNGVYKGKYFDFEAKNTKNKASFPLANIEPHQITHLKQVHSHGGYTFFIICFQTRDEVYLIDAKYIIEFYESQERKSIPYEDIKKHGYLITQGYNPRLHIIEIIDEIYFKNN